MYSHPRQKTRDSKKGRDALSGFATSPNSICRSNIQQLVPQPLAPIRTQPMPTYKQNLTQRATLLKADSTSIKKLTLDGFHDVAARQRAVMSVTAVYLKKAENLRAALKAHEHRVMDQEARLRNLRMTQEIVTYNVGDVDRLEPEHEAELVDALANMKRKISDLYSMLEIHDSSLSVLGRLDRNLKCSSEEVDVEKRLKELYPRQAALITEEDKEKLQPYLEASLPIPNASLMFMQFGLKTHQTEQSMTKAADDIDLIERQQRLQLQPFDDSNLISLEKQLEKVRNERNRIEDLVFHRPGRVELNDILFGDQRILMAKIHLNQTLSQLDAIDGFQLRSRQKILQGQLYLSQTDKHIEKLMTQLASLQNSDPTEFEKAQQLIKLHFYSRLQQKNVSHGNKIRELKKDKDVPVNIKAKLMARVQPVKKEITVMKTYEEQDDTDIHDFYTDCQ